MFCCRKCGYEVASKHYILQVSPADGVDIESIVTIHQTIGLLKATTPPIAEASWFPGYFLKLYIVLSNVLLITCRSFVRYSWSIAECVCQTPLGRVFTATDGSKSDNRPAKFWALLWESCSFKMKPLPVDETVLPNGRIEKDTNIVM